MKIEEKIAKNKRQELGETLNNWEEKDSLSLKWNRLKAASEENYQNLPTDTNLNMPNKFQFSNLVFLWIVKNHQLQKMTPLLEAKR